MEQNKFLTMLHKEILIIEILISNGEMFGLKIVKASKGKIKRGTIYAVLQQMEDKGYVESREDLCRDCEINIPRRKYWATGLGERVFEMSFRVCSFSFEAINRFQQR